MNVYTIKSSTININTVTIKIKSVFKDDSSYCPQIYSDNCSYNYKNE